MVSASEMLSTTTLVLSALSVLVGRVSAVPASFNVSNDHEVSAFIPFSIFSVLSSEVPGFGKTRR